MLTNSCVFVHVNIWISVAYRPAYGPAYAHASGSVYRRERRSLWGYGYGPGHIPENRRSGPQSSTQTSGLVMVSQSVLLTSHHRIQEPQPSLFFGFFLSRFSTSAFGTEPAVWQQVPERRRQGTHAMPYRCATVRITAESSAWAAPLRRIRSRSPRPKLMVW